MNDYKGFHPNKNWKPDIIQSTIQPELFFKKYINTRTPCIISQFPENFDPSQLSIQALLKSCGNQTVQVEKKLKGSFGHAGTRSNMLFKEFVQSLKTGEYYLTTQYHEDEDEKSDDDDEEFDDDNYATQDMDNSKIIKSTLQAFAAPPLDHILDKVPHSMDLFNGLILHQMNLWIGSTDKNGTSSGLHHDFHDNLYFLIQGKKEFTIFSPKDISNMYLNKDFLKVHFNGLIEYQQEPGDRIRSDGAFENDVIRWKVDYAERLIEEANDDEQLKEKAEELLEKALEEMMESGLDGDDLDLLATDLEHFEDEDDTNEADNEVDDSFESDTVQHPKKRQKTVPESTLDTSKSIELETNEQNPPSFSQIPISVLDGKEKSTKYPNFENSTPIKINLLPGQILYLPAGWFHEVKSFGSDVKSQTHVALNYWFAPPTTDDPENPYQDDFWKDSHWKPIKDIIDALHLTTDQ
ncbi:cupin-like domain-containing protein [Globomyces pollinis-pini]|nr:cupin-like domain-containing protein [Globomyces pollinis-pini]